VSENDEVTAQALQKLWWMSECHGNERLKRKAFRRLRKTDMYICCIYGFIVVVVAKVVSKYKIGIINNW